MSGLETAIRTALASAERENPEVRARIYQSARQALEAGLRKQSITEPQAVSRHRERLEDTIRSIEAEEAALPQEPAPEAMAPAISNLDAPQRRIVRPLLDNADDAAILGGETRSASALAGHPRMEGNLDDVHAGKGDHLRSMLDIPDRRAADSRSERMDVRPEPAANRRRPKKIALRLISWCIVLILFGAGAWWATRSGLLAVPSVKEMSTGTLSTSAAPDNSEEKAEDGVAAPGIDPQNAFSSEWTEIFRSGDAAKLQADAQAKVEAVQASDGQAARLTSQSGGTDGDISLAVPAAVLQKMAGKSSTIALTLQSTTDQPTQITVSCDFRSLGACARHRFTMNHDKQDVLLQVRFDRSIAPSADGTISINTDVDGQSRSIDLYAVRILPGQ